MLQSDQPTRILLFRAVLDLELDSIRDLLSFQNPPGLERKYFATSAAAARTYAAMAQARFGDGRYTVVATAIDAALLPPDCRIVVDRGIETVTVPTDLLYALEPPIVLEEL
jgi:hypothetical protein